MILPFWVTLLPVPELMKCLLFEAGYDMYPNPAHSNVNITSTNYTGDKIITIYNVVGQTVSVTENHSLETSINTSSLNAGIYFVEIREVSTGNRYTEKLVKE